MTKPGAPSPGEHDREDHLDTERDGKGRRRVRLHPREGSEHRFNFARRWETRRKARQTYKIWALVGMDFGVVLLIYLLAREVMRRLGGD